MIVVGISAYYHDSAAALVRDGVVVAAAQEERFTRKKHDAGFPHNALRYCIDRLGVEAVADLKADTRVVVEVAEGDKEMKAHSVKIGVASPAAKKK